MSVILLSSGGGSITLQEPVTAASNTLTVPAVNGGIAVTSNDKIGYYDGLGGTVTQLTSKATAVTLNKLTGKITTFATAVTQGAEASFTVNNSTVEENDCVVVNHASGGTPNSYGVYANTITNGSFDITMTNLTAGSLSQALVVNFVVIKGAAS